MAVSERVGTFGKYFGNTLGNSNSLNTNQMTTNALYITSYFRSKGWTYEAIAGVLGNMQSESTINPGRWEKDSPNSGPGFGLVQWTPYTNHTNWANNNGYSDYTTMDCNLDHIIYELDNGGQYYATSDYPESFGLFSVSIKSPYYLASAFAFNYERSWIALYGSEAEKEALREERGSQANYWYEVITGGSLPPVNPPINPGVSGSSKKNRGYNFILFNKRRRTYE